MNNYYVYVYLDPRKEGQHCYKDICFLYELFYIGKGKGNRWRELSGRTDYFINKINKIKESGLEPIVVKLKESLSENESFILESELIKSTGRKDLGEGPLINFTNGGEGTSGRILSKEELKKKRKNFLEIKKEFKKRGYKLLTKEEEYKNAHQKLNYICPRGHIWYIRWNDFRNGNNCFVCRKEKERKNFYEIKVEFEKYNYKLLTEKENYKNNKQKLKCMCPSGHIWYIRWNDFQQGYRCKKCYLYGNINRENIKEIKFLLKEKKLLQREIAKIYNLSEASISMIKNGKIRKNEK